LLSFYQSNLDWTYLSENNQPKLTWDLGTAFDLFISILVLHDPDEYGLILGLPEFGLACQPLNEKCWRNPSLP
jgi:hypothetical protein